MDIPIKNGYKIFKMDVITIFIYKSLNDGIYIIQPIMFEDGTIFVYFFKKTLYGLKLSSQIWYQTIFNFLGKLNFDKKVYNNSLFVSADQTIIIAVYLQNLLPFISDINLQIDDSMNISQDRF